MVNRTSGNDRTQLTLNQSLSRLLLWSVMLFALLASFPTQAAKFELMEATISEINTAFKNRNLTSERLVKMYLERIEAYDRKGPAIRSMITVNPNAIKEAKALDNERSKKGPRSILHGIPVIIKDNYDP